MKRPKSVPRSRPRKPRANLTQLVVRRDKRPLLRVTVANRTLPKIGPELGTLLAKILYGVQTSSTTPEHTDIGSSEHTDIVISPQHEDDDEPYHEALRDHLAALFGSLCDASLTDALAIARQEQARRTTGSN